ncbi:hypothetical protein TruAng_000739 [Truncatella angustata]|nr:hypothetical protein TruAng_000739 [Truncatella angustata]
MSSPLTPLSPRLAATTAKWRNRVPTQVRRLIPIYTICICVLILLLNTDILPAREEPDVFKRNAAKRRLEKGHDGTGFPKKIWQTWMTSPFSMQQRDSDTAKTWVIRNPNHRYEVLTDDNALGYVEEKYGPYGLDRPDIVEMFREVNITIIKADLLRYLVMYAEGGVYADIDVESLKPIHRFIPERYDESQMDLVISVEIDQPDFKDHPILGKKSQSFCQWTFMAKPRQAVMMRLVENIMIWLDGVSNEQKVPVSQIVLSFDEVIGGTGPSAFTAAVLQEMNAQGSNRKTTWNDFHNLDESKIVSRVLVLNVETFAAGQGHSDSGNHNSRGALVKHHYHASNWPSKHTRYSHPVYGEVERCNWNHDCVRSWDENVAEFSKMSPEQQQQRLAEPKPEPMGPGFNGFVVQAPPTPPQQPIAQPDVNVPLQAPPVA